MPNSRLAATIKAARTRLRWRQVDLASGLGVTSTAVSKWEAGTRQPSRRLWPNVAKLLGLPPALREKQQSPRVVEVADQIATALGKWRRERP